MPDCPTCGGAIVASAGKGKPRRYHEGCDPHRHVPRAPRATHCEYSACGRPLPADRRANMRFCRGGKCRQAAARVRERA